MEQNKHYNNRGPSRNYPPRQRYNNNNAINVMDNNINILTRDVKELKKRLDKMYKLQVEMLRTQNAIVTCLLENRSVSIKCLESDDSSSDSETSSETLNMIYKTHSKPKEQECMKMGPCNNAPSVDINSIPTFTILTKSSNTLPSNTLSPNNTGE